MEAFGEDKKTEYVVRAKVGSIYGKISKIIHDQETIFQSIANPIEVIRHHSLAARSDIIPKDLKITSAVDDGTIIAIHHKEYPVE